ncbi:MAG: hypothetical protein A2506_13045 [Elusimicrobia bacterium RIFOXYD12_FULL_66_9]|nr:MAG: hypothetical protein A2506_13045 [Elusimicrobia bacterium RIFOXYD12_FULL_66_9]
MRRFGTLFVALILTLPAGAAVTRVPIAASAAVSPVAALGSMLTATLPAMTPLVLAAPAPTPAILDTSKVAALISRAQALPAAAAPAPAAQPLQVLEAVNSTLRDLTPAQIQEMPEEKLQALASVIMDGAAGRAPKADLAAVTALSEANLAKVESLRGAVSETLHNPGHNESHEDMITSRGVPETVKRIDASGMVFRHYTTQEGLDAILKEKSLINGFMPYVQLAKAVYRTTFRDLTGVFLTLPKVEGDRVGVPARDFTHYVDLRVPGGLPVLEVEKGAIFLVPMPARTRGWVADLYRRWVTGGGLDSTYKTSIEDVERDGGVGPALSMPIEIVRSGRVGR